MAITNKDIEKMKEIFPTREEVLTRLDKVMGELEKAREDRVFAKAKDDEQDKRLNHIETKVFV